MKPFVILLALAIGFMPVVSYAQAKPAVKAPVKKKPVVKKPVVAAKPKNDTLYNYYTNKKVSVKTGPMVNNEQTIWLYDPFGNVTYTFINSRNHGSTHTDFKFRPDGSVSETNTSMQPDGGIQHYKTKITFSQQNEPEWKQSEDYPAKVTAYPDAYYWDKATKQWEKQQASEDGPVPVKKD